MRGVFVTGLLAVFSAAVASGTTITVSTGAVPWMYTGGVDVDPSTAAAPPAGSYQAYVVPANPAWSGIVPGSPYPTPPQWISAYSNGDQFGYGGLYTYEYTRSLSAGSYVFSGAYSSDNMVVSFLVNSTELVTAQPNVQQYQFNVPFTVSGTGSLDLKAVVWNAFQTKSPLSYSNPLTTVNLNTDLTWSDAASDNPTGFILYGFVQAAPVPAPAAIWGGTCLLALLGARRLRRRD